MDDTFEGNLLDLVDKVLAAASTEAFKRFKPMYRDLYNHASRAATAQTRQPIVDRDNIHFPSDHIAALDALLPRERRWAFLEVAERLEWTISNEFELTDKDRSDGYRPLEQFWPFLRQWRERYRAAFGR